MALANAWADGYSEVSQNLGPHVRSHPRDVVVSRMRRGDLRFWSENTAVLGSPHRKQGLAEGVVIEACSSEKMFFPQQG
ncbi:hypothetical protein SAMN05216403_11645 [Nitrosospira multiformis ATCC 25196]|uniref:Uncharacterized protein n=1 Tax=Nitrosospira multiformis (strain ATCC 25196 / NCIMB 11849 / C 71) TaxID=323848 RepID=A0A1H5W4D1_NITMU|nr:hypothetical protein SAMN05216403_11645 [Nitrosospira multiformis ATCC 25196]